MTFIPYRRAIVASAVALLLSACAIAPIPPAAAPVHLNLVALNDFHGNLEPSRFIYKSVTDGKEHTVLAGGADAVAAAVQAWRKEDPQLLLVGAGDLVGGSPPMSLMWADEPTIAVMNRLGVLVSAVGNHEFDQGRVELLRQQNGGCASPRPDKACQFDPHFGGAKFAYLAANVFDAKTGQPLLPAYRIEQAHGVKVAFIGAVLQNIASVTLPSSIAGLKFTDEADAINSQLPALRAQGVGVFVVLIHQGGNTDDAGDQPDCQHLKGDILPVLKRLDPAIKLVVSGHTHEPYTCRVDGRLVTEASMGGHMLSRIGIDVDPASNSVTAVSANNVVMLAGQYAPNVAMDAYVTTVRQRSAAALDHPVGRLAVASVKRDRNAIGETALGDVVADAALAATGPLGAQIAFTNDGGMRADLNSGPGQMASVGQVQQVQPFGNTLVLMTLTGAQIHTLLEQQHIEKEIGDHGLLQVSDGFSYRWDVSQPFGRRVVPGSVTLHGKPLADAQAYRIVVNNFLSEGGDGFPMFKSGTDRVNSGLRDGDALLHYLAAADKAGKPAGSAEPYGRIQGK